MQINLLENIFNDPAFFYGLSLQSKISQYLIAPEELSLVKDSHSKRVEQFKLGRAAAHQAIHKLNPKLSKIPILRKSKKEPLWPEGVTGSITHTDSYGLAVVATSSSVQGVGLDIEKIDREVPRKILSKIASNKEVSWIESNPNEVNKKLIVIFSAKEAIFKALYPKTQKYFGFKDVILVPDSDHGLTGKLLVDLGSNFKKGFQFRVFWQECEKHIISGVYIK